MSINALHIPAGDAPMSSVVVDEQNALSYYPYVSGGPVEAGYLDIEGAELVLYVNARYRDLPETAENWRASGLFALAGVPMAGGMVRGDALLVLSPGDSDYERSLPPEFAAALIAATS